MVHTRRYPAEGLDLSRPQVGVIGIGATGIQVIQTIAPDVGHLTVFARTPQYVVPMKNPTYDEADVAALQGPLRGAAEDAAAQLHRLRVRLRARVGQ